MQVATRPDLTLCTVGSSACVDWFAQPHKVDKYACLYGPVDNPDEYVLDLTECNTLAYYYDPASQASGHPYADPGTGTKTETQTGPNTDHQTQNQPSPQRDPDGSNSSCFPSGWGVLNPIEWVERPTQCALQWAFVPRPQVVQQAFDGAKASWDDTFVGAAEPLVGALAAVPAASGCNGIPIDLDATWPVEWHWHTRIGDACGPPLAGTAAIVRGLITFLIIGGGILAMIRIIARVLGYSGIGSTGGDA